MEYTQFREEVLSEINKLPKNWRKGQKVFNYIDMNYRVARKVQFDDHIDCFYNDGNIEDFIKTAYKYIKW